MTSQPRQWQARGSATALAARLRVVQKWPPSWQRERPREQPRVQRVWLSRLRIAPRASRIGACDPTILSRKGLRG